MSSFKKIDQTEWKEEKDMYPAIIEAMQSTFYVGEPNVFVVDTHKTGDLRPDVSVGDYPDDRLPYCLWYFIEFKLPGGSLLAPEHCGQVLDYFHKIHEKQPHRREFIGILSDFVSAWVFTARYGTNNVTISRQAAPSLADAIVYADAQSRLQYTNRIPTLDKPLTSGYAILAVAKHHFVLEVPIPACGQIQPASKSTKKPTAVSQVQTRNQTKASIANQPWRFPSRHPKASHFVLKIVHGEATVTNELKILREIRDAKCMHLPELVWEPRGDKQLGLAPVGKPIDFRQSASTSRKIVNGLIDGLQYLHSLKIIHRDIRPSNLVLDQKNDVVIVDYETSVMLTGDMDIEYSGGFICWPKRLLEANTTYYAPEPADDLSACILVVLHLLFPSRFDAFRASNIGVNNIGWQHSVETMQLLKLWNDIEHSQIWGAFVQAAKDECYDILKGMADVFCHV
jgi:hypothetical protein